MKLKLVTNLANRSAFASFLAFIWLVGCTPTAKTMHKDIESVLVQAVEKNLDPDSVIKLVGKRPDLDSRIHEQAVYLMSEEFEMHEGKRTLKKNEVPSSGFDKADSVLIWFSDNGMDSGILWEHGRSKYFNGKWIAEK